MEHLTLSERRSTSLLTSSGVFARCWAGWCGLSIAARVWWEPGSPDAAFLNGIGWVGDVCRAALAIALLLMVVDVVVNDMLPPRFVFAAGRRYRPLVFMALAAAFGLMAGSSLWWQGVRWLTIEYAGAAALSAWGAVAISKYRYDRVMAASA